MRVYLHFEDARRVATTKVDFAPEGPLRAGAGLPDGHMTRWRR